MTNSVKRDTGVARLPAIPKVNIQDKALASWVETVTERLEVREGRGNEYERAVTVRELQAISKPLEVLASNKDKKLADDEMHLELGNGWTASVNVESFAQKIIDSRLFKKLNTSLDDQSRFDHMAKQIRDVLLRNIADEAKLRGAAIEQMQKLQQSNTESLAMMVREVTASVQRSNAGVRSLNAAWAQQHRALATNVLQLSASLGNYYQDGTEGRASLEQEMTTIADRTEGLLAQYTLKVQAGGALAGFGIAAEEVNGKASSAFIIQADKFAIVSASYTGGMLTTPRAEDMVFGVDDKGIYLNRNVYLKGDMRIDGSGQKLEDGMRGSVQVGAAGKTWSDATARQAVWQAIGKAGSAPNNGHLVIGDAVTISAGSSASTRYWNGTAWINPGFFLNGDMLVDGSVAARSINSNGLTIRDNNGNVILSAGGMDAQWIKNLKASQVGELGSLATKNDVSIGSNVKFPDGTTMNVGDFINRLSRINGSNIGTFMDVAAIGTAYIGNAAVDTLQIAGNAVTIPVGAEGVYSADAYVTLKQPCPFIIIGTYTQGDGRPNGAAWGISVDGVPITLERPKAGTLGAMTKFITLMPGQHRITIYTEHIGGDARCGVVAMGAMR